MFINVLDSDYQLGSAAQTPGLNNSVNAVEYGNGTSQSSHVTPLTEAYIARSPAQGYAAQPVSKIDNYSKIDIKIKIDIFLNMSYIQGTSRN